MTEHVFQLKATWPGGRNDVGSIESGQLRTRVSIPPAMDGPGVGTNPDEMLLGAAATCYIITLAAMLERAGIRTTALSLESEGVVDVTHGVFTYRRIVHRPDVTLADGNAPDAMERLQRLVQRADERCMITKALHGNVPVTVEPVLHDA